MVRSWMKQKSKDHLVRSHCGHCSSTVTADHHSFNEKKLMNIQYVMAYVTLLARLIQSHRKIFFLCYMVLFAGNARDWMGFLSRTPCALARRSNGALPKMSLFLHNIHLQNLLRRAKPTALPLANCGKNYCKPERQGKFATTLGNGSELRSV